MSIEFKIQSVTLQYEDIQEHFPALLAMVSNSLPKKKKTRRRKRKPKVTAGQLINEIISDIEQF